MPADLQLLDFRGSAASAISRAGTPLSALSPRKGHPMNDRLLSIAEVAQWLGCGPRTVRRLIADGRLTAHKIGRVLRIDPGSVEAFLASTSTARYR
jgi:excisionase family DNA binding protein